MTNAEKGGYDVDFVDNPKDVTCCICLLVLREPMQAEECGHRFCKSCVEDLQEENSTITCPHDRTVNKKHKGNCEFCLVKCNHEECTEQIQRRHLVKHIHEECLFRNIICDYCATVVKFFNLEKHGKNCEKMPVLCERCGSDKVPKHLMKEHLKNDCPFAYCEYSDIGCHEMIKREFASLHKENSSQEHLDYAINKLREQEKAMQTKLREQENLTKKKLREQENLMQAKLQEQENLMQKKLQDRENSMQKKLQEQETFMQTKLKEQEAFMQTKLLEQENLMQAKLRELESLILCQKSELEKQKNSIQLQKNNLQPFGGFQVVWKIENFKRKF